MSNENNTANLSITLWKKKGDYAVSHRGGLTADQIAEFKKLKEGDQLVVYINAPKSDLSPSHTLKVFVPRNNEGNSGGL